MSSFLQTPEFFEAKFAEANHLLGKHLLVGISFDGGVVLGKSFNQRSHNALQWAWHIPEKPSIVLAAVGDFRDIGRIKDGLRNFVDSIDQWVGGRSLTAHSVAKFLASYFGFYHEEPQCLAAEMMVIDIDTNEFFSVSFTGRIKRFSDFAVAGCKVYTTPLSEEEVEVEMKKQKHSVLAQADGGKASLSLSPEMLEAVAAHMVEVKAPAVDFLKKKIKTKYSRRSLDYVRNTMMMVLGLFDPPSESEQFELYFVQRRKKDRVISVDRSTFDREFHREPSSGASEVVCPKCAHAHHGKKTATKSRKKSPPRIKRAKKSK